MTALLQEKERRGIYGSFNNIIIDNTPLGIVATDLTGSVILWNKWIETKSGIGKNLVYGKSLFDIFPDEKNRFTVFLYKALKGETLILSQAFHKYLLPLPSAFPAFKNMQQKAIIAPCYANGTMEGVAFFIEDVTERLLREKVLKESEERYRSLSITAIDAIISISNTGEIIFWNEGAKNIFGYSDKEILNRQVTVLIPERFRKSHMEGIMRVSAGIQSKIIGKTVEVTGLRKNGDEFPAEISIASWKTENGMFFSGILRDITERKSMEEELRLLANRDGLTGIANRRYFEIYIDQEWKRAARSGQPVSILMIDIDFFKAYNDNYGHQGGDECLKAVASTLKEILKRPSDIPARYGGEEFAAILPETGAEGALKVAETIRESVESLKLPHIGSKAGSYVTVSIGVSTAVPSKDFAYESLIKSSDAALYRAKNEGRNRVVSK